MRDVAIVGAAMGRQWGRYDGSLIEMMAEAALELCTERHVGEIVSSRELLHRVARPVRSLDGKTIIGDAFLAADLEVVS